VERGCYSTSFVDLFLCRDAVLHQVRNGEDDSLILAGVFDGHGGNAASRAAEETFPVFLATSLGEQTGTTDFELEVVLKEAWADTCTTYRNGCSENEECVAEYDEREGIIMAQIGSRDLVAGTTATSALLSIGNDDKTDKLTFLNCGDSRSILVGHSSRQTSNGRNDKTHAIHFATRDHVPDCPSERARLTTSGHTVECTFGSRSRLRVGSDYLYAVSRSLEGQVATSQGITSAPDVTTLNLSETLSEEESGILLLASDGLFEVADNERVAREVVRMRHSGLGAGDSAKRMCEFALQNGSRDNISVVIIHFE